MFTDVFSFNKYLTTSLVTGVDSGACLSFQSGINSSSDRGSKTLPERI